jgi:hypothetical protein
MPTDPVMPFRQRQPISRRSLLRAAGAGVALPFLDAMIPAFGREGATARPPKRLVAIHATLGMMPQFFFPAKAADGQAADGTSPYLDLLADHRGLFTALAGLSHPNVNANHIAAQSFLTSAPYPGTATFRNSRSLDQFIAEKVGGETRFPYLTLEVTHLTSHINALSVSRSGVPIPAEASPQRLYRAMFVAGTPEEKAATLRRIEGGGSVLDLVLDKKRRLEKLVEPADRARLDQYFQSVREVETQVQESIAWEKHAKPSVALPEPQDIDDKNRVFEKAGLMFDMIRLALQTDSTRTITLNYDTHSVVPKVTGVQNETHHLTHHGNEPAKIDELRKIEEAQMKTFAAFLRSIRDVGEEGGTLLDHTQVFYGSCLGNANSHSNRNLPIILAGGGYRHPGLLAFDEQNNEPLANLYVTMLQRLGIESDSFGSSTGTLRGLDA